MNEDEISGQYKVSEEHKMRELEVIESPSNDMEFHASTENVIQVQDQATQHGKIVPSVLVADLDNAVISKLSLLKAQIIIMFCWRNLQLDLETSRRNQVA